MKNKFNIKDSFWSYYQELVSDVILPYQYDILNDSVDDPDTEKSHSFENFRIAAGESKGEFYGYVFQDSDTAKWLEAVAYSLMIKPDKELERKADDIISLIGRAQQPDGYMNTYFIVKEPENKWKNLRDCHELYCAGHFIEAGAAYYEATGKRELLNIVIRLADLIYDIFIKNKTDGIPGHPEIELALVRLYRTTGAKKYLELAKYFIDIRGKKITDKENLLIFNSRYHQSAVPVREETNAVGHAVRAVYLYTGMAMTAKETGDETLLEACERMWNSIVKKRMYITGGIGSSAEAGEAFTMDYDLPNDTAYNETCASIGLIFFAKAMLEMTNNAKYADVAELALYNTVLAGVQRDGKRFFYTNPLEVDPIYTKKIPHYNHIYSSRPKWHACACCPPNVAKLIASLNQYAWHTDGSVYYSDLFIGGRYIPYENTVITTQTDYPYSGKVKYSVSGTENINIAVRRPEWCFSMIVTVNGVFYDCDINDGYAIIENLKDGDTIIVDIDITPHRVYSNTKVHANDGKCAFMAGSIIYCFEDCDNNDLNNYYADKDGEIILKNISDENIGNVNILQIPAYKMEQFDSLYRFKKPKTEKTRLVAIPYYAWGNRKEGKMKVWIAEK